MRKFLLFFWTLAFLPFLFLGCTAEVIVPITYGSVQICSDSSRVYGNVYVDGSYAGYVYPYECIIVGGLAVGRRHTVRIVNPWGYEYFRSFYLDYSGQVVTVPPY